MSSTDSAQANAVTNANPEEPRWPDWHLRLIHSEWFWRTLWGAAFALAVGLILYGQGIPDQNAGAVGASLVDGWIRDGLIPLTLLLLVGLSAVLGFRLVAAQSRLRAIGWWLLTAVVAACIGIAIARPLMHPGIFNDDNEPGWTITVSVTKQLHAIPGILTWMSAVSIVSAMIGLAVGLVVRFVQVIRRADTSAT